MNVLASSDACILLNKTHTASLLTLLVHQLLAQAVAMFILAYEKPLVVTRDIVISISVIMNICQRKSSHQESSKINFALIVSIMKFFNL